MTRGDGRPIVYDNRRLHNERGIVVSNGRLPDALRLAGTTDPCYGVSQLTGRAPPGPGYTPQTRENILAVVSR